MPIDALILGGGIAGLWTLRTLLDAGYDAALVEARALGAGQTIASQGILHAGTKYALTGQAAEASRAAGEAAAVWGECLRGGVAGGGGGAQGAGVDLSAVSVLSPHTHLFTTPGVGSRLTGLAASKALAIGPRRLGREELPGAFGAAPAGVDVYELDEPVLDMASLLRALSGPVRARIIRADELTVHTGEPARVTIHSGGRTIELASRVLILTAGEGNQGLLFGLGLGAEVRMQRRPLHMVMARGRDLPRVFAHCVSMSDKPRATITSAVDRAGRSVWYVGGQLAESGVERSRGEQIAAARAELSHIVPWVDLCETEWATLPIDRAEGFDGAGRRPDTPVVRRHGAVIACWPTKLVLAPLAAARVLHEMRDAGPSRTSEGVIEGERPEIAAPPWESGEVQWT